jgi:hypothetical protein
VRQVGLGGGEGGEAVEAEFGDEAILQGLPEPLDAAFGLRGARGDVADAEVAEDLAELGGVLGALQLLLQAPVRVIADEDTEAIAVQRHGQAMAGRELVEQGQVAVQILLGAEEQGADGTGGVVDGAEQGETGAGPEPVELTAVEEDEGPHARRRGAAGAVLAGPAAVLGGQAEGAADPADRAAADGEALELLELLGQVGVVEPAVGGLQQLSHPVADLDLQGAGRGAAPQAVEQPGRALGLVALFEAAELPHGHAQCLGALTVGDLARERRLHQAGPGHLLSAHSESLPCAHGGTFLLTR